MKRTLTCLAIVCLSAGIFSSCRKSLSPGPTGGGHDSNIPDIIETSPAVLTQVPGTISPDIQGYYEALPARYQETTNNYPVIFFFHGGGQYGDGHSHLDTLLADGIGRLLRDKKFPPSFVTVNGIYSFIVIIPQLKRRVGNEQIDSLVDFARRKYRIDSSRIYFSGFSLGGRQATDYAAYKPSKIAAVASMAGMPQIISSFTTKCQAIATAALPVWQFHARNDSAWTYTESEKFVNTINGFSPLIPARLTLFEKGVARLNHDCWTEASDPNYREDGKNIYEWMLGYTR